MTKLEISCQLDIIERWQNLSPETQKFLLDYDSGLNFTKLLWAKQFYKEVAELSNYEGLPSEGGGGLFR